MKGLEGGLGVGRLSLPVDTVSQAVCLIDVRSSHG